MSINKFKHELVGSSKTYHVFSNEIDEWFDNLEEATTFYNELKEDYGTARL